MKYPYPVKDWKNKDNYPMHDNVNLWAWEFMRRSISYQKDVGNYNEMVCKFKMLSDDEKAKFNGCEIIDTLIVKGKRIGKDGFFRKSMKPMYIVLMNKYYIIGLGAMTILGDEEFSYSPLPDPKIDIDSINLGEKFGLPIAWWSERYNKPTGVIEIEEKYDLAIKFDLSIPIRKQIEHAERILSDHAEMREIKQPNTRKQLKLYPVYTRVLDAYASGAGFNEIASIVFPSCENIHPDFGGNKRVRNAYHAAKKIAEWGYRDLIYL